MSSGLAGDESLLLYVNVSGELFYIVAHRMRSQGIDAHLQSTVFNELVIAICSPEVVRELVDGALRLSHLPFEETRTLLKGIVQATIMNINDYSMLKLFELALIATKYQFTVCEEAADILLVVLNHLDSMRQAVKDERALELTEALHALLVESYGAQSEAQMTSHRLAILRYVRDVKLKMTNLVKLGLQDENGEFVAQQPHKYTRTRTGDGDTAQLRTEERRRHSLQLDGDRVITLGLSIYEIEVPEEEVERRRVGQEEKEGAEGGGGGERRRSLAEAVEAVQGLDLCSALLAGRSLTLHPPTSSPQRLPFHEAQEKAEAVGGGLAPAPTVSIDARLNPDANKGLLLDMARELEGSLPRDGRGPSLSLSDLMEAFCSQDTAA